MSGEIEVSRPKRSHKSKKEQKRKSSVRIVGGGFVERVRHPQIDGGSVESQVIRVDAGFANWLREEAKRGGHSITDITRTIHGVLLSEEE